MVLLYNGNKLPSVPLVHAANMKESYKSMNQFLGKVKYDEVKWKFCGDLKVATLLLGTQIVYTKYCSLLCDCDNQDKTFHCVNKLWPKRTSLTPCENNAFSPLIVLPEKIFLPPSHIKLVLMKTLSKVRIKLSVISII